MEEKKPTNDSPKENSKKYQKKIKVKGSFLDIIQASVIAANKKIKKKTS